MKNWKILLKDLSMRLPYEPYCKVEGIDKPLRLCGITVDGENTLYQFEGNHEVYSSEVKPILFSPKNMKNKSFEEFAEKLNTALKKDITYLNSFDSSGNRRFRWIGENELDFYLGMSIDIFGLIEKDLAVDYMSMDILVS